MAVSANDKIVRGADLVTVGSQVKAKLAEKVSSENIDNMLYLTSAEYEALATKDPNTIYVVTDGGAELYPQDGKSAYQIWLDEGNTGTEADFLASLKGDTGVSADYPITIHNSLDSTATDEALAALQGKVLDGKITQLGQVVTGFGQLTVSLFKKAAFLVDDAGADITALEQLLSGGLTRIEAVYTQTGTIYEGQSLDYLRSGLVVTAYYMNGTSEVVNIYALSGDLSVGTSTITVSLGGKIDTFNVTVTAWTMVWDKSDGGKPSSVAPANWTEENASNVSFVSGEGLYWNLASGFYQVKPTGYFTNQSSVWEVTVRFLTLNDAANFVLRLSNGTTGVQASFRNSGVVMMTNDATPIPGVNITTGVDYVIQVVYTTSQVQVYLDGVVIYSGNPSSSVPSLTNMMMITTLSNSNYKMYVRRICYKAY